MMISVTAKTENYSMSFRGVRGLTRPEREEVLAGGKVMYRDVKRSAGIHGSYWRKVAWDGYQYKPVAPNDEEIMYAEAMWRGFELVKKEVSIESLSHTRNDSETG